MKIACFGENCVDINYIDGVIMPGGNCVNAAIYCSQLGHDAAYVGTVADDRYGQLILASLDRYGVDRSMVKIAHGETGRSACRLVNGDRTLTMENGGGVIYTDPIVVDDAYLAYFRKFDLVHANYWAYLDPELKKIKAHTDVPICYDFSQAWDEQKIRSASEFADYIMFSERKDLDLQANLAMLRMSVERYGVKMGIMTFGIDGAYVYNGRELFFKEPYNADGGAVDTTGCGDSWISGFITSYMENMLRLKNHSRVATEQPLLNMEEKKIRRSFLTAENEEDYERAAIRMAMCVGNMRARSTCQIQGAYGCGITIEEFGRQS